MASKGEKINASALKKQFKSLKSKAGQALDAPMPTHKKMKIEQEENYEINKKQMKKWLP